MRSEKEIRERIKAFEEAHDGRLGHPDTELLWAYSGWRSALNWVLSNENSHGGACPSSTIAIVSGELHGRSVSGPIHENCKDCGSSEKETLEEHEKYCSFCQDVGHPEKKEGDKFIPPKAIPFCDLLFLAENRLFGLSGDERHAIRGFVKWVEEKYPSCMGKTEAEELRRILRADSLSVEKKEKCLSNFKGHHCVLSFNHEGAHEDKTHWWDYTASLSSDLIKKSLWDDEKVLRDVYGDKNVDAFFPQFRKRVSSAPKEKGNCPACLGDGEDPEEHSCQACGGTGSMPKTFKEVSREEKPKIEYDNLKKDVTLVCEDCGSDDIISKEEVFSLSEMADLMEKIQKWFEKEFPFRTFSYTEVCEAKTKLEKSEYSAFVSIIYDEISDRDSGGMVIQFPHLFREYPDLVKKIKEEK